MTNLNKAKLKKLERIKYEWDIEDLSDLLGVTVTTIKQWTRRTNYIQPVFKRNKIVSVFINISNPWLSSIEQNKLDSWERGIYDFR